MHLEGKVNLEIFFMYLFYRIWVYIKSDWNWCFTYESKITNLLIFPIAVVATTVRYVTLTLTPWPRVTARRCRGDRRWRHVRWRDLTLTLTFGVLEDSYRLGIFESIFGVILGWRFLATDVLLWFHFIWFGWLVGKLKMYRLKEYKDRDGYTLLFYLHSLKTVDSYKLSVCMCVCFCVCLSRFYGLYLTYYRSDFDQT